jgi:hypothetical protein
MHRASEDFQCLQDAFDIRAQRLAIDFTFGDFSSQG